MWVRRDAAEMGSGNEGMLRAEGDVSGDDFDHEEARGATIRWGARHKWAYRD